MCFLGFSTPSSPLRGTFTHFSPPNGIIIEQLGFKSNWKNPGNPRQHWIRRYVRRYFEGTKIPLTTSCEGNFCSIRLSCAFHKRFYLDLAVSLRRLDILPRLSKLREVFRQGLVCSAHQVVYIVVARFAHFLEFCLSLGDQVVGYICCSSYIIQRPEPGRSGRWP